MKFTLAASLLAAQLAVTSAIPVGNRVCPDVAYVPNASQSAYGQGSQQLA
jgi:hypothetical protein